MAARTSTKKGNTKKTPKKTISGGRGTPTRQTKKTDLRGIFGIILFCLGILMFASQFIVSTSGFLYACRIFQRGMGGILCLGLPILVCVCGIMLVFFADVPLNMRRMICGVILFVLIETFFQVMNFKNVIANGYGSFLYESYLDSSLALRGGGLIGALLAWPLYTALDAWGAYIVLFFACVIVLTIMTGFSFSSLGPSISEWTDDFRENMAQRREERAAIREAKEEEKLNREAEEALERSRRKKKEEPARDTDDHEDDAGDDGFPPHFGTEEAKNEAKPAPAEQPKQVKQVQNSNKKNSSKSGKKKKNDVKPAEHEEPQPYPEDVPVTNSFKPIPGQRPVQPAAQPYIRQATRGFNDPVLYIERDDEFERTAENENDDENRGRGFTREEAERAFLYGVNAESENGDEIKPGSFGTSLGDPIPLYPDKQKKQEPEPDPYEAYRNKQYDTGVAVGYGNEQDETAQEPIADHEAEEPAGPVSPDTYAAPVTAPEKPVRPVPPVEPVMPKMPAPPVAPVPPYEAGITGAVQAAAAVGTAAAVASVYESPAPSGPVKQMATETPAPSEPAGKRARRRRGMENVKETPPAALQTAPVEGTPSGQTASGRQIETVQSPVSVVGAANRSEAKPAVTPFLSIPVPVTQQRMAETAAGDDFDEIDMNREHPEGAPSSIPAKGFTTPRSETKPAAQPYQQPVRPETKPATQAYQPSAREMQPAAQPYQQPARPETKPAAQPYQQSVREIQPAAQPYQPTAQGGGKDNTIVQLRENRLDGTPMVPLPRDMHDSQIQPKPEYIKPSFDLLTQSQTSEDPDQRAKDESGMRKLLATLESFGVQAKGLTYTHGPAITRYEIQPAPGVKVSRIVNLVDDIALNMASTGVRIEAPIPGKAAVGIEVPNESISMVTLRDVIDTPEMAKETSPTAVALGKGISGKPVIADMAKMPHVLIAGATGSGKSVCINTIINSIIFRASPDEVRLILVDPKVVELSVYNGIPHLLIPVVTDPKKASAALDWAVVEMEHRYKRFESMGVRDIKGYNAAIGPDEPKMYKIIVIIDELADLMMVAPGEVEESICRLAQLARAAGIHLVIATQRPSVNVITGVIKANIPSRIAFAVSSQIDSRTILDTGGAEKLLGKGDMLYAPQGAGKPTRVQGCFVSDAEVERIVRAVKSQHQAEYSDDVMEKINSSTEAEKAQDAQDAPAAQDSQVDEMLNKAIELAVESGQVSISMLQRRLRVGYARAGRLVDEMTLRGITAEAEGPTKPRQVLITREEWKRMQENEAP